MKTQNKTLIAYTTKGGATEKTAKQIEEVLHTEYGLEVDLVNLGKQTAPSLGPYENIVVATGVRKGAVYEETLRFLGQDFGKRRLAYFTCSGFIYPRTYQETVGLYTTDVLADYPRFKPIATEAFGGYIRILGLPIARKMDLDKVKLWARVLGKKFAA